MLAIESMTVRYGRVPAVRKLSLNVDAGEVVGLVGANGAGKTTTLYAVAGCRTVTAGDIVLEGESILGIPPERIVRKGIAIVPENRRMFGSLDVGENLLLGKRPRSRRTGRDNEVDLDSIVERFPILKQRWKQPAGTLSGGEQQQLAIARALVTGPRLLMLDEPSLGLAPRLVDSVFDILEGLRESGQTILLVEQNVRRTLAFADRTYIMRSGTVSLEATREEISQMSFDEIEAAFFGTYRADPSAIPDMKA